MTDDAALVDAVRSALRRLGAGCALTAQADRSRGRLRRLPWFMAFAGGVFGAAAAIYGRGGLEGITLSTALFAVVFWLLGIRLTRRMHTNEAPRWALAIRRRALEAAVEALKATDRLPAGDELTVEDAEGATLDFRLLAQTGATPPTPNSYLEEALAGRARGVAYALGATDYGYQLDRGQPDLSGRLLQIELGRSFDGAAVMSWETGDLARVAHNWFASVHLTARPGEPPPGTEGVRVQRTASANAFESLPRTFFDALGAYLTAAEHPPFLLAAGDRWLLLYLQGVGALTGDEAELGRALARTAEDETAREGPALAAAAAIPPLHALVATLSETAAPSRSPLPEA